MRNTLYKGSTPKEELEFAKTALALGQPVDVEALIDAFEKYLEKENLEIEDLKIGIKYWQSEAAKMEIILKELTEE